tara:strand:+ start:259389 stop:259748 length:360 start_codon:yes stop_codon:yes gene_type:complete
MKYFELKKDHLTLLKEVSWDWNDCAFGAPAIDCKRPFGNSGYQVYHDINAALGGRWDVSLDEDGDFSEEAEHEILDLYTELMVALQVIFTAQSLEPGVYQTDSEWPHQEIWSKSPTKES